MFISADNDSSNMLMACFLSTLRTVITCAILISIPQSKISNLAVLLLAIFSFLDSIALFLLFIPSLINTVLSFDWLFEAPYRIAELLAFMVALNVIDNFISVFTRAFAIMRNNYICACKILVGKN